MFTFKIFHNGELKKEFNNQDSDFQAFKYLLGAQSQSVNHALKYEGWKVEVTNEATKEVSFWKHYV